MSTLGPMTPSSEWWAKKTGDNDVGTAIYGLPAQIFPANNWWNLDVSSAPLSTSPASEAFMAAWPYHEGKVAKGWYRLFCGDSLLGIPIITIGGGTPQVDSGDVIWIDWDVVSYGDESDYAGNGSAWYQGKFPIPTAALTEAGWTEEVTLTLKDLVVGDRHLVVFDVDSKYLYEAYNPFYNDSDNNVDLGGGIIVGPHEWKTGTCAVWDTTTNNYRTPTWTSTDVAGLQILPGLCRYDEVVAGPITHAFRYCQAGSRTGTPRAVWPATHYGSSGDNSGYPPTGTRLRLKSTFNISGYSTEAQRILQALKTYGIICVDYGSVGSFDVVGTADVRWGNWEDTDDLAGELRDICINDMDNEDFEMIEWSWGHPDGWEDLG